MPPVILGSAEWSTKQRMLSLFWNAAQPSIRTTMTVNYPWLKRCGVYLLYISVLLIIYAISGRGGEIRSDSSPKGSIWWLRLTAAG